MMRKKLLAFFLSALMVFVLAGCGGASDDGNSGDAGGAESGAQEEQEKKADRPSDANSGEYYGLDAVESLGNTDLTGKTIYWLGSSVTAGMAADGLSMSDYIAKRNGCTCVRDAVSGTTMLDQPITEDDGSVRISTDTGEEQQSFVYRLENSKYFDKDADIDLFVIQISTNDCGGEKNDTWGEVTADDVRDRSMFDRQTTLGATEYMVSYVQETWGCPVVFWSGAWFGEKEKSWETGANGSEYDALLTAMEPLEKKWGVKVIDLFHDKEFNDISDEDYKYYMSDKIHPKKAGYLLWWTPAFEEGLADALK